MTTLDDNQQARLLSLRDQLIQRAAENRCQLCLGYLDEPEPACVGPHTGSARRSKPSRARTRRHA